MSVEQKITEALAEENKALKAQIDCLLVAAAFTDNEFRWHGKIPHKEDTVLSVAIQKTPQQCLAEIRADAVDDVFDMIAEAGSKIEDAGELIGHTRVLLSVGERANKLRENNQ